MELGVGSGGLKTVTLRSSGASECVLYTFGAHVVSWKDASGTEKIYTSPTAVYNGAKAIRGGIPVCFPQFAMRGPLSTQHGWARNTEWEIDTTYTPALPSSVRLVLRDSEHTRSTDWPHAFELALTVSLGASGDTLSVDVACRNTQSAPFDFTFALHSYFTCDSKSVVLEDYDGLRYIDTIDNAKEKTHSGSITFGKEVDRVYIDTPATLHIKQSGLKFQKKNMPEAVVWNPYIEKAAKLSDMPDDGWNNFICIEPARAIQSATVQPGETWHASLELTSTSQK